MPVRSDYHLHTSFSADSTASMDRQIRAAIDAGMESICFTEHVDLDSPFLNSPPDDPESDFRIDYEAYRETFLLKKIRYSRRIRLFFGLELGLNTSYLPQLQDYLAAHTDFDFIIGSTHSSGGMDPYYDSFFEGRNPEEAYRCYFADALANVRSFRDFDTYGHLDYILRYGPAPADGAWIHRDGTPASPEEIARYTKAASSAGRTAGTGRPVSEASLSSSSGTGSRKRWAASPSFPRNGSKDCSDSPDRTGNGNRPDNFSLTQDEACLDDSGRLQGENCPDDSGRLKDEACSDSSGLLKGEAFPDNSGLLRGEACPLIRRDATYYYEKYADLIDPILFELILSGRALEVNTSALRKGFPEPNPGRAILKRYHDFGGRLVTIGSDAHDPGGIAFGFDRAETLLKECGFTQYATFENRKPILHDL